jgi:cellulose synthase/poly-beta-1,6-N-acetylglucosamine synthase-like glycosyltransferase
MTATTGDLPTLTVVVVCRNSALTLSETLESVAAQEYPGWWEVLVVDNGSMDGTAVVAGRFAARLPGFRVLRPEDPGHQARGLNVGIEQGKGEAFVFVDSDDVLAPGYLRHLGAALATAPLVGGAMDVERLNPPDVRSRRKALQRHRIDEFCGFLPAVVGASLGARREALLAVGGFDEALPTQHDLDICWRMHRLGYAPTFVPGAVLHYRYRCSPGAIFRQEYGYGQGEVLLYRKFAAAGLGRRSPLQVAAAWARLALAAARVRRPGGRARLATQLGVLTGRLRGSLRYRTLYL